jgi:CheY-like chemotaxis protein
MMLHYNEIRKLFAKDDNDIKSAGYNSGDNDRRSMINNSRYGVRCSTTKVGQVTSSLTRRILIVDDESDITSALKDGLERYEERYNVQVSNDPILSLSNYKCGAYDLIILDVRMPKMNGFEVYKVIRKLDGNVKICFWTAYDMAYQELKKAFPLMDETYFIKKPITMDDLVDRIEKITG